MRGIVKDVAALVAFQRIEKALEGRAVEYVLAGMDLEGDIDAGIVERIENRFPASRQFIERCFDQAALGVWQCCPAAVCPVVFACPANTDCHSCARRESSFFRRTGRGLCERETDITDCYA